MWKCRKFSHLFCPVSMWPPKKKRSSRWRMASFSPIICWCPKNKKWSFVWVLQLFSALCATYQSKASWTAAGYSFWQVNKNADFGGRKNARIHKISVRKCRKNFALFCAYREHWARYLFLFSGIGYMFCYRVMKHCLHLSDQLTYQDCFTWFGAGLRAHPVFVCSDLEFWFTCVSKKTIQCMVCTGDAKIFWFNPDIVLSQNHSLSITLYFKSSLFSSTCCFWLVFLFLIEA